MMIFIPFWLIGGEYVYIKVLFELWRKRWTNINLCWPRLASGWPGFHAALGWRSLWKEIDHNKKNYDVDTIAQALNSPHVDGGNRDSGSDADPSDCSSDVQVVETGRSPYQQPTPNLRNKELKRMTISCISEMMGESLECDSLITQISWQCLIMISNVARLRGLEVESSAIKEEMRWRIRFLFPAIDSLLFWKSTLSFGKCVFQDDWRIFWWGSGQWRGSFHQFDNF